MPPLSRRDRWVQGGGGIQDDCLLVCSDDGEAESLVFTGDTVIFRVGGGIPAEGSNESQ